MPCPTRRAPTTTLAQAQLLGLIATLLTTPAAWAHDTGAQPPVAQVQVPAPAQAQPHAHTAAPSAPGQAGRALPALGDAGVMSLSEERALGERIARELYRDPSAADDPVLGEYLDSLWQPLLTAARQSGELPPELDSRMAWRVVQIRDREVNAFALPGGYLGIQYGLIATTQDRSELATVMAHELAHVTQRHIARMLDQQARISPLMLATMVVGAIAASRNPAAGQALMVGGQAAGIQSGLNFSRDMEREADRIGHAIHTRAGFAPEGAVRMYERLQAASRLNDNGDWPYLRTHPLTTERIGDMQQRQARQTRPGQPAGQAQDTEHRMMAARARVLAETNVDNLRQWARLPQAADFAAQPLPQRAGLLYQAAMAQAALRDWPLARQTAQSLAQLLATSASQATIAIADASAAQRQARLLQADLAWRAGDAKTTLALLDDPTHTTSTANTASVHAGHAGGHAANGKPTGANNSANTGENATGTRTLLTMAQVLGTEGEPQAPAQQAPQGNPANRPAAAARTLATQGRAARLWRAMAHTHLGQAAEAASSLQGWLATHPGDTLAWQALSQAWQAQGHRLRALRAQAEAHITQSDWQGARDRLQAAQELSRSNTLAPGEHIEASIIDTRLQQATDKLREQQAQDKRRR